MSVVDTPLAKSMTRVNGGLGLGRALVAAAVLLGPVAAVLILRLPLINQLDYADAWFYSGYAWVPKHHFAVYELNYFAVRFPAILSIGGFDQLFGTRGGYVALRYVLAVVSGAAVYLGAARFSSPYAAAGAALLLYLNPFFSRLLLWDYASFIAVSAAVIGVGLWYWSDGRTWWWTLPAGAALAVAVLSNPLLATLVFIFVVVEGLAAVRRGHGAVRGLAIRLLASGGAAAGVFLAGWVAYRVTLGTMSPDDLLRPTVDFLVNNDENAAPYRVDVGSWLLHEPRIWAPVIASAAAVAVLGRRILGVDLVARCGQFLVGYTAFLWAYRALVTSSVVETWWAYSVVVVAMAPAAALLLEAAGSSAIGRGRRTMAVLAVAVMTAVAVRWLGTSAEDGYLWVAERRGAVFALLLVGLVTAALVALRKPALRLAALAAVFVTCQLMLFSPSTLEGRGSTGLFVRDGDQEWTSYEAGKQLAELIRDNEGRGRNVFLWYPGTLGLTNIAWVDLPQYAQTVHPLGVDEPLDELRPLGVARLSQATATAVLVMSPDPRDVADAARALAERGFRGRTAQQGTLADGGLRYALIEFTRKP